MKRIASGIACALKNPLWGVFQCLGRIDPKLIFRRYMQLARKQGFRRTYFILSFDCDTEKDIDVVESVHDRLAEIGITPVYAVPGELLEKGRRVYQKLAQNGAEFINHGYIAHASYCHKVRRYISTHFYDELTRDMIVDDIRRGHLTYESVLGKTPNGFRVPHFGTFQRSEQLNYLHRILEVMGYAYSSSTVPYYGFRNGPVHQTASTLKEIPVSGCYDNPLRILDSWSYSYLPERTCYEGEYEVELATMVRFFQEPSQAGLLNFYADPSHIYDSQEFFEVIKLAVPIALNSYKRLLETLAEGERGDG